MYLLFTWLYTCIQPFVFIQSVFSRNVRQKYCAVYLLSTFMFTFLLEQCPTVDNELLITRILLFTCHLIIISEMLYPSVCINIKNIPLRNLQRTVRENSNSASKAKTNSISQRISEDNCYLFNAFEAGSNYCALPTPKCA